MQFRRRRPEKFDGVEFWSTENLDFQIRAYKSGSRDLPDTEITVDFGRPKTTPKKILHTISSETFATLVPRAAEAPPLPDSGTGVANISDERV